MRVSKSVWLAAAAVSLIAIAPFVAFRLADMEKREISPATRQQASGSFVRLADGFTHYELAGPEDAATVVLAAGATVPHYIWDPTFAALRDAGFRVLRYTFYGRGLSDRPDIPFQHDLYTRQLAGLLDSLALGRVTLVGLSFGASVVTTFAVDHPDRVQQVIYVGPSFRAPYTIYPSTLPAWLEDAIAVFTTEGQRAEGQLYDFLHPERFPDWPLRYREQMRYRGFRRSLRSDYLNNAEYDQTSELRTLGQLGTPVAAIWGRQDSVVPFSYSANLRALVPQTRLFPIDSSGHLPQWEQTAAFNEALLSLLRPDTTAARDR